MVILFENQVHVSAGRSLHKVEAQTLKALSPNEVCLMINVLLRQVER